MLPSHIIICPRALVLFSNWACLCLLAVCKISEHVSHREKHPLPCNPASVSGPYIAILHQLNNKLAAMRLYAGLLRKQLQQQSNGQRYARKIEQAVESCDLLMLRLNRQFTNAAAPVNLEPTPRKGLSEEDRDLTRTGLSESGCAVQVSPPDEHGSFPRSSR
jgi:hypothetical protein